jgi:hypothetical protein
VLRAGKGRASGRAPTNSNKKGQLDLVPASASASASAASVVQNKKTTRSSSSR